MPDTRPWDVVTAVRSGTATGVFEVEDPSAVAAQLTGEPGVAAVSPPDLVSAVAGARVRLAVVLVDRARRAEASVTAPHAKGAGHREGTEHLDEDWQAIRFALLILLFALPAGLTVYAVDGMVLAAALPAAALVTLGIVVLVHRPPGASAPVPAPAEVAPSASPPPPVDEAPAVRAAEAHLRRQQAAWKLTWWERHQAVPPLDPWSPVPCDATASGTIVVVDGDRTFDEDAAASAPAAVRVVVLRART